MSEPLLSPFNDVFWFRACLNPNWFVQVGPFFPISYEFLSLSVPSGAVEGDVFACGFRMAALACGVVGFAYFVKPAALWFLDP